MKLKKNIKRYIVNRTAGYLLKGVDAVVIVSTGRTGTQFFEGFYRQVDPNAFVFHEPNPDFFEVSLKKIREKQPSAAINNAIISARGSLLWSIKNLIKRISGKPVTFIESNPFIYPLLDHYDSIFRSVKMVYITRDYKTYLLSAYNKDPQSDGNNNFYGDSDLRKRLTAVDFNETSQQQWHELPRIERIAWYWNKCNNILFTRLQSTKEQSIHLTFEDLFEKSSKIQEDTIASLLSLTHPRYNFKENKDALLKRLSTKKNASDKLSTERTFNDFDPETQLHVQKLVAPMKDALKYGAN